MGTTRGSQEAIDLLREVLPPRSDRLAHTVAVGRRARSVAGLLRFPDGEPLVTAAYLHDVGYAAAAVGTGMHQLDGARYLRRIGYDEAVCRLVAHHTFAQAEARNKGLDAVLDEEFPVPSGALAMALDVVTFCDLTTSNTGVPTTVTERFAGIFARYAPEHVVAVTMREVEPLALDVVGRVQAQIDAATRSASESMAHR